MSVYSKGAITINAVPVSQKKDLPDGWAYVGCYTDTPQNRILPNLLDLGSNMTIPTCLKRCQQYGYPTSGAEFGTQCLCGDPGDATSSSNTPVPESDCNTPCKGNTTVYCGAGNRVSLYTYNSSTTPLYSHNYPQGNAAGAYNFLIGGVTIPLITQQGINGKVTFVEKHGTGPNGTGAYELDPSLVPQGISSAWREMNGLKTDVFCSAGLILPDKAGRVINIGGWSGTSTFGVRLYWPDGSQGTPSKNDWTENAGTVHLQAGRWYPGAMVMSNGSILVVGGEDGSNGPPVPSLEVLPSPSGAVLTMDWLQRTDPYNLYPFLVVLPSGGIFVQYFNEARILDPVTFNTIKVLPNLPCHISNPIGGRTYPFEGSMIIFPQRAPYTDLLTVLVCGGSTPNNQALDNCVSIQPDAANPQWVLERMPSPRVLTCMTALPDGTILILNGSPQGQAGFGLASKGNNNAVLYNPSKPIFSRMSVMANTTIDRLYHSEAILLQDGRVLVSGSDPEADGLIQEYRVETFSPPYLLNGGARPSFTITNKDWSYGQSVSFSVAGASGGGISVSLLGAESSTHGNSFGQRTIMPAVSCGGGACTVTAPPNNKICPPGWFQMFVMVGGVPSVSQYVRIGGDPAGLGNWPQDSAFKVPGV